MRETRSVDFRADSLMTCAHFTTSDLMVRWIDRKAIDELVKLLLAAINKNQVATPPAPSGDARPFVRHLLKPPGGGNES